MQPFSYVTIYGINNCDKIKKAKTWLELQNISYTYVDYRKQGVSDAFLKEQLQLIGVEKLINKRGTTWRKLSESDKIKLSQIESAVEILQASPALIKRPLLILKEDSKTSNTAVLGFTPKQYLSFFNDLFLKKSLNASVNS